MTVLGASPQADLPLIQLFLADAAANAAILEQRLQSLVDGTGDPAALRPDLELAIQSIKGAASIVELLPAKRIADELQASLRRADEAEAPLVGALPLALLRAAEVLAAMAALPAEELFSGKLDDDVRRVVAALRALPAARGSEPALPAAASAERSPPAPPELGRRVSTRPRARSAPPTNDAGLLGLFYSETESCAAALSRGLVRVEGGDTAALEELMRAAHSIKGAARIVGIGVVTRLAHAMEDCFVAAQERRLVLGRTHFDKLLEAVDVLSDIARRADGGLPRWQAERAEATNELAELLERAASGEHIADSAPAASVTAPAVSAEAALERRAPESLVIASEKTALVKAGVNDPQGAAKPRDRVVRVAAQSINRLMGLAGESLVESRRVQTLGGSMQRLKRKQGDLADVLETLARRAEALDPETAAIVADAKARSLECRTLLVEQIDGLESYARRVDDLSDRLYREALKSRMRPFGDCAQGLPRMVRDLGRQLGKHARLLVAGEATDVDRDVLESLDAPLNHLLRNALDHGIEPEQERLGRGKPALGTIRLEARHHAGMLAITVSDDGRGIDPERVRAKIVERALLSQKVAAALTTPELFEFVFLPGFSTAKEITDVSGRGVGLDVVRSAVEAASGVVKVSSDPARGTTFHLQLPVTRSVMRAVVAEVAGEAYAFPLLRTERILRLPSDEVRTLGSTQYFVLGDANVSLVCAQQILGFGLPAPTQDDLCIVVIGDRTNRYGVLVDRFLGEHDLVVRPLDARLGKVQDLAAAAILMNGSPALIFDVDDVVRSIEKLAQAGRVDKLSARGISSSEQPSKRILVVDDSITVREAERQLLANRGYVVDVAVDGIDGWNSVSRAQYDLVISDIDMPRMNGLDLVRAIKQDSKLGSIPIVIVSYKDREEDRMRGLDAGANYYLTKSSFHDESLVQAVEELIGAARS